MATDYRIQQKQSNGTLETLHPETKAKVVQVDSASAGIQAGNVQDAIKEINDNIKSITGGGVVTGVKGDAETNYRLGQVNITKENIGLGNVDNTADADKPISTPQQNALNNKVPKTTTVNGHALSDNVTITKYDIQLGNVTNDAQVKRSEMGTANGVATLDEAGKIPSAQLPSYVDDVNEYDSRQNFPMFGETGKIYVDTATNKTYRWSGTMYVEISASLALGETSSTAYAGDKGKANAEALVTLQNQVDSLPKQDTDTWRPVTITGKSTIDLNSTADPNGFAKINFKQGTGIELTPQNNEGNYDVSFDLAKSGVTAGTYSVVQVDAYGRVVTGAQSIEVGISGQTTPSASLAVGGIFFQRLD